MEAAETKNHTSEPITLSNSIRLTGRQWLVLIPLVVLFALYAPTLWELVETFEPGPDYRVPREQKQDYWLYQRFARLAATEHDGFVVGDSVVWGVYSKRDETLSHYLNRQAGAERFANFGMIGAHPLALEGLLRHYGGAISGKNVVLQCNLLWLTMPKVDLQVRDKDVPPDQAVFHAGLIPQFSPNIPAYNQEVSRRLGFIVEQHLPISQLSSHLQQAYFQQESIPAWTMQHPYEDPTTPLRQGLPPSADAGQKPEQTATVDHPWVDLNTSLQWPAFQRVVKLLQSRGNRVFVVVGPFNEHLLSTGSKKRCQEVKATMDAWLGEHQVAHRMAEVLPKKEYGDLSHPLPAGYDLLARRIWADPQFQGTMKVGR